MTHQEKIKRLTELGWVPHEADYNDFGDRILMHMEKRITVEIGGEQFGATRAVTSMEIDSLREIDRFDIHVVTTLLTSISDLYFERGNQK